MWECLTIGLSGLVAVSIAELGIGLGDKLETNCNVYPSLSSSIPACSHQRPPYRCINNNYPLPKSETNWAHREPNSDFSYCSKIGREKVLPLNYAPDEVRWSDFRCLYVYLMDDRMEWIWNRVLGREVLYMETIKERKGANLKR
jgi:hypothetical protein